MSFKEGQELKIRVKPSDDSVWQVLLIMMEEFYIHCYWFILVLSQLALSMRWREVSLL